MRVKYTCTLDDFREALRANGHLTMSVSILGWWASIGLLATLGNAAAATLPNLCRADGACWPWRSPSGRSC